MLKVGVLVSGSGTNLQTILGAEKSDVIRYAKVVCVLSNSATTYALQHAATAGIANECISPANFPDREAFHRALLEAVEHGKLNLIALAGYLVEIPDEIIRHYRNRILSVHPSLIPSFYGKGTYGLKVHEQALRRSVKVIGATMHLVDGGLDGGLILLQKAVEVEPGGTSGTLQRHVMGEVEWILLPRAIEEMVREASEKGDGA